jgi:hypothetical protein
MNKVILDPDLRAKLHNLDGELELCDESGRTVGHVLPADVYRDLLLAWADAQISEEELERRRRQPGGRTLAEIWKRLGRT